MHCLDARAIALFGVLLSLMAHNTQALSYTFGQMHKYASIIYMEKIFAPASAHGNNSFVLKFGETDDYNEYTITGMHAYDFRNETTQVFIVDGGIGYNYTRVLFVNAAPPPSNTIDFDMSIYGVAL